MQAKATVGLLQALSPSLSHVATHCPRSSRAEDWRPVTVPCAASPQASHSDIPKCAAQRSEAYCRVKSHVL